MEWRKPSNMRYTQLCMYIDENMSKLTTPGEYPAIENKIWNYLWLLVKALAIKRRMFTSFQDYDGYAFYAANRLFFAFRKNLQNQGKIIKGKKIVPIKSSLNYTKALLNPMKLEYQRETFNEVITAEYVSKKFDAFAYKERLKDAVQENQGTTAYFLDTVLDTFKVCDLYITRVLAKTPFLSDSADYKWLKISLCLNCINNLKLGKGLGYEPATVILWNLPKSMAGYMKVLIREFCIEIKKEIMDCYKGIALQEAVLEKIIAHPEGEPFEYED